MIIKGSEDWELMADLYKIYAKAVECENPYITTKAEWYKGMNNLLNSFVKKYEKKPVAWNFAQAIATYVSLSTKNE